MSNDPLKQFIALKSALLREQEILLSRLAQIENALAAVTGSPASATAAAPAPARRSKRGRRRPPKAAAPAARKPAASGGGKRTGPPLHEIAAGILKVKPLTRAELLQAIEDTGYKFKSKKPINSLGVMLYTHKNIFKRSGKKFTVAK